MSERRIRCKYCRGDGLNHAPGWDRPGAAQACPCCGGTGKSNDRYDLERNGSTCGVKGSGDLEALTVLMRAEHPHLEDLRCESLGRYDYRTGNTVGILTTWKNRDFEDRYARDQKDALYPVGYWQNVEGFRPYTSRKGKVYLWPLHDSTANAYADRALEFYMGRAVKSDTPGSAQWHVEDRQGRVLSTHDTRAEAVQALKNQFGG